MAQSQADRWLRAARDDLETARILLENQQHTACAFYSQQSAEKALKALLLNLNLTMWGHSTRDLLCAAELAKATGVTANLRKAVRELDRHYVPSRHPDAYPSGVPGDYYDEETAREALTWARAVVDYVTSQMPGASQSPALKT